MGVDEAGHDGTACRVDPPVAAARVRLRRDRRGRADPGDTVALHQH